MDETPKKMTVMVYLAGNNNLGEECVYSLTSMKSVGSNTRLTVVAQLETSVTEGTLFFIEEKDEENQRDGTLYNFAEPRRKLIRAPNAARTKATSAAQQVKPGEDDDSETYADVIKGFVKFGVDKAKERNTLGRYLIVLAGHANGALGSFLPSDGNRKSNTLTIPDLEELIKDFSANILRDANGAPKTVDILGLDCCLMSMAEVCYALRKDVKILVGSEGFEPMAGWPYDSILEVVNDHTFRINKTEATTDEQLKALAKNIVTRYIQFYTDYQHAGISVDQSALDLSQMDKLADAVKLLSKTLKGHLDDPQDAQKVNAARKALIVSHFDAQSYKRDQYTDLFDFCDLLKQEYKEGEVARACQNVMNVIAGKDTAGADTADDEFKDVEPLVLKSCYSGSLVQHSHGVSIYFPWSEVTAELESYSSLEFAQKTRWHEFLAAYLDATKRAARDKGLVEAQAAEWGKRGLGNMRDTVQRGRSRAVQARPSMGFSNKLKALPNLGFRSGDDSRSGNDSRTLANIVGSMKNPPTNFPLVAPCAGTGLKLISKDVVSPESDTTGKASTKVQRNGQAGGRNRDRDKRAREPKRV